MSRIGDLVPYHQRVPVCDEPGLKKASEASNPHLRRTAEIDCEEDRLDKTRSPMARGSLQRSQN